MQEDRVVPGKCPINPTTSLDVGLFGAARPEGLEEVLHHYGEGCSECWEVVVSQAVTLEELRCPVVHPVIGAISRVALPPALAPTVRLGRILRQLQPRGEDGFTQLQMTRERLLRLVLEELVYRADAGSGDRLPQWLGELEAFINSSAIDASSATLFLLEEGRLILGLNRYAKVSQLRLQPPWGRVDRAAREVDGISAKVARLADQLIGKANDGDYFRWLLRLARLRMEGSGGTLQMWAIEEARNTLSQRTETSAFEFEMLMDAERERVRRGKALGGYTTPDIWLYLGVIEESGRVAEEYPCIPARAARHVEYLGRRWSELQKPYAGLYWRLGQLAEGIHPELCGELVQGGRGTLDRRSSDWLSSLRWGEVVTASEDVAANLAASWLVMHPEEAVEGLPLAALTDVYPWKVFRDTVQRLGKHPLASDVFEAGRRAVNLYAAQGGSPVERLP